MNTYPVDLKEYELNLLAEAIAGEISLIDNVEVEYVDNNDERYELERRSDILAEAFDVVEPFVDEDIRNKMNYPPRAAPPINQSNREGYIRVTFTQEQIYPVIDAVEKIIKFIDRRIRLLTRENADDDELLLALREKTNTIRLLDKLRLLAPSSSSSAPAGSSAPNTESSASFPAARPHTNRRATRKSRKNRKSRKSRKNRKASRRS